MDYRIRRARKQDGRRIRRLVRRVRINPFRLHWRNFFVAVDNNEKLVGCGQLKPHGLKTIELASIAVEKEHRKRGVARAIIEQLLAEAPRPLYLTCLPHLTGFYARFGFSLADSRRLPRHFRNIERFARVVRVLHRSRAPVIMCAG